MSEEDKRESGVEKMLLGQDVGDGGASPGGNHAMIKTGETSFEGRRCSKGNDENK